MEVRPGISVDLPGLIDLCERAHIAQLSLFGSALSDDFNDDSDIDLLVEFAADAHPGLFAIARLELELAELFEGREVELRTAEDLSHYFRDVVRSSARVLHRAA
jgi:uncharacterized protein